MYRWRMKVGLTVAALLTSLVLAACGTTTMPPSHAVARFSWMTGPEKHTCQSALSLQTHGQSGGRFSVSRLENLAAEGMKVNNSNIHNAAYSLLRATHSRSQEHYLPTIRDVVFACNVVNVRL
jgi:hypothetical protein